MYSKFKFKYLWYSKVYKNYNAYQYYFQYIAILYCNIFIGLLRFIAILKNIIKPTPGRDRRLPSGRLLFRGDVAFSGWRGDFL